MNEGKAVAWSVCMCGKERLFGNKLSFWGVFSVNVEFRKVCESWLQPASISQPQSFHKTHFMCRLIEGNDFLSHFFIYLEETEFSEKLPDFVWVRLQNGWLFIFTFSVMLQVSVCIKRSALCCAPCAWWIKLLNRERFFKNLYLNKNAFRNKSETSEVLLSETCSLQIEFPLWANYH